MKKFLIILAFILSHSPLEAAEPFWDYVGGPNGGPTIVLEISKSNTLYLGTYNGLFKSTNSGKDWVQIFNFGAVRSFSVYNDSIIALSSSYLAKGDLYITTNAGKTWDNKKELIKCYNSPPTELVFDNYGNLYCKCNSHEPDQIRIYKSSNFGLSFTNNISTFEAFKPFERVYLTNTKNINGVITGILSFHGHYPEAVRNIYSTLDGSMNFLTLFEYTGDLTACESFDDSIHVLGTLNGVYFTSDNGKNWAPTEITVKVNSFTKLSDNEVLALGYNSVFYSNDRGITWSVRYNMIRSKYESFYFYRIYHGNGDTVYATGSSFYISTDKGVSWKKSFDGLNSLNITDLAFDKKGNIYCSSYGGIHKSSDNGNNWNFLGLYGRDLSCVAINESGHLFTAESSFGYGIARSTDDGASWTISTEGLFCGGIGSECPINDMYINKKGYIVAIGGSEYISKDNGDSWITFPISIGEQCFGMNNQGDLFTAGTNPLISRSIDDGETWSSVLVPTRLDFSCLEGIKSINFTKRKPYGFSYCGYNSSNNGLSWSKNGIPGFGMRVFFVDSLDNYFSWATSYSDFSTVLLYRSTNQGQSWDSLNSGVFHTNYSNPITKFFVSPNGYIFIAVENGGLYRSRKRYVSVEDDKHPTNTEYIYPNPASDFIEVQNPNFEKVSILNILGETIFATSEVDKIDVSSFPPGIYFVRIGDKVQKFIKL